MGARETVAAFIAAIESHDVDAALALMSPNAEYDNVPMSKAHGHDEIRALLSSFVADPSAPVEFRVVREAATDNVVFNERLDRLHIGGKAVEIAVAGVFEVDPVTGTISLWRDYFDMGQLTAQLS